MVLETQNGQVTIGSPDSSGAGGGSSSPLEIQDEGVFLTTTNKLNFKGNGVLSSFDSLLSRVDVQIDLEDIFQVSCGKEGSVSDIWLKGSEGIYFNISPYQVPVNCELFGLAVTVKSPATFTLEVYKDSSIISVPNQIDALHVLSISGSSSGFVTGIGVSLVQGSKIGVYLRGSAIDPLCGILLRRM